MRLFALQHYLHRIYVPLHLFCQQGLLFNLPVKFKVLPLVYKYPWSFPLPLSLSPTLPPSLSFSLHMYIYTSIYLYIHTYTYPISSFVFLRSAVNERFSKTSIPKVNLDGWWWLNFSWHFLTSRYLRLSVQVNNPCCIAFQLDGQWIHYY